jgi:F0F1-type ATP synthase assembly protein I
MLGWGNWFVIALALIGIIIGVFSSRKSGMYLNIVALMLALFRLIIGGGIV